MQKKYSIIDILFFILLIVFGLICLYEFIRFIIPLYSFIRAIFVFVILSWVYYAYKNKLKFSDASKINFKTISSIKKKRVLSARDENKVFNNENTEKKNYKLYLQTIFNFIMKNKDRIFYSSFVVMSIIILLSMIFDTWKIFWVALALFYITYIVLKTFGLELQLQVEKSESSSINMFKIFVVSLAFFYIVMKLIFDSFSVAQEERLLLYLVFLLTYIAAWFFMFFRYTFSFSWLLRPYNILSAWLVSFLVILLVVNNGIWEILKEKVIPEEKQEVTKTEEEISIPGIISNEANLWNNSEIEYEQVLVSDIYNIEAGISVWSLGQGVSDLQIILGNLQYFTWEVSWSFDDETKDALTDALITECDWPESTRGIFGPQAKECIDSLEITIPKK